VAEKFYLSPSLPVVAEKTVNLQLFSGRTLSLHFHASYHFDSDFPSKPDECLFCKSTKGLHPFGITESMSDPSVKYALCDECYRKFRFLTSDGVSLIFPDL